jgi:hypothetical protein
MQRCVLQSSCGAAGRSENCGLWLVGARAQQPAEDDVRDAGLPAARDGRGLLPRLEGQSILACIPVHSDGMLRLQAASVS